MKRNWPLVVTLAGAALALQACDVSVHETPKQDTTASTAPATEPTPPATDTAAATNAAATNAAPVASATDTTTAAAPADTTSTPPADTTAMANPQSMPQTDPQQPGTNAMGAPAAPAPGQAQPSAMDSTPAGTAAPTELARFLQDNPPGGKERKSASSSDSGSPGTQKADAKAGSAKGRKS